jgi:hypothetical protein
MQASKRVPEHSGTPGPHADVRFSGLGVVQYNVPFFGLARAKGGRKNPLILTREPDAIRNVRKVSSL